MENDAGPCGKRDRTRMGSGSDVLQDFTRNAEETQSLSRFFFWFFWTFSNFPAPAVKNEKEIGSLGKRRKKGRTVKRNLSAVRPLLSGSVRKLTPVSVPGYSAVPEVPRQTDR